MTGITGATWRESGNSWLDPGGIAGLYAAVRGGAQLLFGKLRDGFPGRTLQVAVRIDVQLGRTKQRLDAGRLAIACDAAALALRE